MSYNTNLQSKNESLLSILNAINELPEAADGINVTVVGGTTQPTSPVENTIWVNTDTAINGYAFSATAPTSPVEGMVWFKTSTNATVPINIDKKNEVILYPVVCQQYIGSAWVTKTAKTYQDGQWKDWWKYLYDSGATDLTISFRTEQAATGTLGSEYISMTGSDKYSGDIQMDTEPPINLTPYSVAKFTIDNTGSASDFYIGFGSTKGSSTAARINVHGDKEKTTLSLDISALTGEYYFTAERYTNSSSLGNGTTNIYSAWLE